jgi:hypothetical protein
VFQGNLWLTAAQAVRKGPDEPQSAVMTAVGSYHVIERASLIFPLYLFEGNAPSDRRPKRDELRLNLAQSLATFLSRRDVEQETIFHHVVAIQHSPAYRIENASALRMDWPRVPLPGEAQILRSSAALGLALATLLDPETPAPGISVGTLRVGPRSFGTPTKRGDTSLGIADLDVTASWGAVQIDKKSGAIRVMPGSGLVVEREYTAMEHSALEAEGKALGLSHDQVLALLGRRTIDVHLNADAWWSNVPSNVWNYTLGGYQVVKKWLSYRERAVLGRALKPDEVAYVSEVIRRIAAILLMGPELDANYAAAKAEAVEWKDGKPVDLKAREALA